MNDQKYSIEMTVITPLAVGAGDDNEWALGFDYVQKDGKVYILDMKKVGESGVNIDLLSQMFLKSDMTGISTLLGDNLKDVSRYVFDSPATTTNPIKSFLRTQLFDKPLVAGSSIKGAIRSILFTALRDDERDDKAVFGEMKDGTVFMRFIRVGDIEMPDTCLVNTKVFNLRKEGNKWAGGWKHDKHETTGHFKQTGFNTLYECVPSGKQGYGSIVMAAHAFEMLKQMAQNNSKITISHVQQKTNVMQGGISGLFKLINNATKRYLQKEKAFFEKYKAVRSDEVIDNIDYLLSLIPNDSSYCIMKMSAGAGFHSITGDWKYDDYDKTGERTDTNGAVKKKYKSRKIAEFNGKLQLMGFVKLRAINADEVEQAERRLNDEHQASIDKILSAIKNAEVAQQEKERQARQKAKEQEEAKQRNAAFEQLIDEATTLYLNDQWDEAIAKANEASALLPERSEPTELITKCETQREIFEKSKQPTPSPENNAPLSVVLKGVSSAGNMIGRTTKWIKSGNSFGESEYSVLLNAIMTLSSGERKNMAFKKRKELVKAIGEELANRLINEVGT